MKYKAFEIKKEESLKSEPMTLKEVDLGVWNGYDSIEECKSHLCENAKKEYTDLRFKDIVILPIISFDYNGIEHGSEE